jgi:hypothetical protein
MEGETGIAAVLFLKTDARWVACLDTDLLVIETHFGQRAIAPATAGVREFIVVAGKNFFRLLRDIKFFGPKMFAAIAGLHIRR